MIIIDDIEQRSEQWHKLKAGIPSASNFSRIIKSNGDPSKSQQDYLYELAGEKIIGMSQNGYQSWDMQRGIELEDEARKYYEFITGETVKQVGFIFKDENRNVGCSPDGLISNNIQSDIFNEGIEIKCQKLKNHVKILLDKKLPADKYHQVQGCMWICNFHRWIFMSYYPGLDPFIIEVHRDYKFTAALEYEMERFIVELESIYNQLKG